MDHGNGYGGGCGTFDFVTRESLIGVDAVFSFRLEGVIPAPGGAAAAIGALGTLGAMRWRRRG
jgi:hypothetical protein